MTKFTGRIPRAAPPPGPMPFATVVKISFSFVSHGASRSTFSQTPLYQYDHVGSEQKRYRVS